MLLPQKSLRHHLMFEVMLNHFQYSYIVCYCYNLNHHKKTQIASLSNSFSVFCINFVFWYIVGLGRQYNNGNANVKELERLGFTVVHGINVHTMSSDIACLDMTELSLIFLMQGKVWPLETVFLSCTCACIELERQTIWDPRFN